MINSVGLSLRTNIYGELSSARHVKGHSIHSLLEKFMATAAVLKARVFICLFKDFTFPIGLLCHNKTSFKTTKYKVYNCNR